MASSLLTKHREIIDKYLQIQLLKMLGSLRNE